MARPGPDDRRLLASHYLPRLGAYLASATRRVARCSTPGMRSRAVETIVVCDGERDTFPPPITLPGQLERVSASFSDSASDAIRYATSVEVTHAPTRMYRIEDVVYDHGRLYKDLESEHVSSLGWPTRSPARFVEAMCLCSSSSGSRFFGDWLLSDVPLELLAREAGLRALKVRPHTRYPHLPALNALLGLADPYTDETLRIGSLFLVDDGGFNDGKRRRLRELRARVRRAIAPEAPGRLVYLGRGAGYASGRRLTNEAEIVSRLEALGFELVNPDDGGPERLLERMMDCAVVVGIEGSQLAYGFLSLSEGGVMIALQPPYGFQSSFRPRCVAAGLGWGFLVGREDGAGFRISPEELEEVLEPYRRPRAAAR